MNRHSTPGRIPGITKPSKFIFLLHLTRYWTNRTIVSPQGRCRNLGRELDLEGISCDSVLFKVTQVFQKGLLRSSMTTIACVKLVGK